jgi:hypothetical protein
VVFITTGAQPILNGKFQHTFASFAVDASMSDDLIDMVDAITNVGLDLFTGQGLLC